MSKFADKEILIDRLMKVGYEKEHAERIYRLYERQCDLDSLLDYILSKESINESLSEIL